MIENRLIKWTGRGIGAVGAAVAIGLAPAGCGSGAKAPGGTIQAFVTVAPQAYFVERVGGDCVAVDVLVPPGQSPHTYEPTPRQMARLEAADVYFRAGMPIENRWFGGLAEMVGADRLITPRAGVALRSIEGHSHEEGDEEEAAHGKTPDPHIWLDPVAAKTQARTIAEALGRLDPGRREDYGARLAAFEHDLDSVHALIGEILAPCAGRAVYVFHPSYGYFLDRYGLRQTAIEREGKEPAARDLADLIDAARADSVRALFVQPQFARKTAAAVAHAVGAELVTIDPLARDYLPNLVDMARRIAAGTAPEVK